MNFLISLFFGKLGRNGNFVAHQSKRHHRRTIVTRAREDAVVPRAVGIAGFKDGFQKAFPLPGTLFLGKHLDGLGGVAVPIVKVIGRDLVRSCMCAGLLPALLQFIPMLVESIDDA